MKLYYGICLLSATLSMYGAEHILEKPASVHGDTLHKKAHKGIRLKPLGPTSLMLLYTKKVVAKEKRQERARPEAHPLIKAEAASHKMDLEAVRNSRCSSVSSSSSAASSTTTSPQSSPSISPRVEQKEPEEIKS